MNNTINKLIERKVPETFMPEASLEQKISVIVDEWNGMTQKNDDFIGALKDLEYTLNLLNISVTFITDEKFKVEVEKWLDYYRKLSK